MKRKHIIIVMVLVLAGMFTMQGCVKDETPTPIVYKAFSTPVCSTNPAVKPDGTVFFTGSTIDLVWTSNTGGNADNWTVYYAGGDLDTVYTNVTKQTLTVPVEDGVTYLWHLVAVDKNGIKTTGPENEFTAINGTNPEMSSALTVTTDVKSVVGVDLTADQVVDLRLLILSSIDLSIVEVVDNGNANEEFAGWGDLPDGEYIMAVDIFSTKNFGDLNKPINLSFVIDFAQLGILNSQLSFPNVMTNVNACAIYRTNLATVTKVGSQYTIAKTVSTWVDPQADPTALVGTWSGYDADQGYPSEVVSAITTKLVFTGIGRGWMQDAWGEVITKEYPISMNFNYCAGTLTIPKQKIQETTWNGAPQTFYSIQGSGTFDMSGDFPAMTIHYDFIQGTTSIAAQFGLPFFELVISLDPGKKSPISSTKGLVHPKR